MKKLALLAVLLAGLLAAAVAVSLALPAGASAHRRATPTQLIRRALGPGTEVWGCRPHGHGTLCEYKTPWGAVEYENGETAQDYFYSAAVVERGRVRF